MKLSENKIKNLQSEATVFRFSQRFKKINIPFISTDYEYKWGQIFVIFEVENWATKIINNPITGLQCIQYTTTTNNNTRKVAILYT